MVTNYNHNNTTSATLSCEVLARLNVSVILKRQKKEWQQINFEFFIEKADRIRGTILFHGMSVFNRTFFIFLSRA